MLLLRLVNGYNSLIKTNELVLFEFAQSVHWQCNGFSLFECSQVVMTTMIILVEQFDHQLITTFTQTRNVNLDVVQPNTEVLEKTRINFCNARCDANVLQKYNKKNLRLKQLEDNAKTINRTNIFQLNSFQKLLMF